MASKRQALLTSAQRFCEAFSRKDDIIQILSHFSTTHQVFTMEYGEPALAPFLGRPYVGTDQVQKYFETIGSLLSYENMKFSHFVVDAEARRVAVKGEARFTWLSTQQSWDEKFAYILDFDDEEKITDYQVWADSGAAYLARIGKLDEVRS